MIEVKNLSRYVPHGRKSVKLKPRVQQHDVLLRTHSVQTSSFSKPEYWHLTRCENTGIEDEVYVNGCTAVWSRGSGDSKVQYKSFTVDTPITNVVWCTFEKQGSKSLSNNSNGIVYYPKRSLCLVEEKLIKAFSEDGNIELSALPFKVTNILSIPGGLVLERNVSQSEVDHQKSNKVPTLFSVLSALDEPRPIILRYGGKTSYMSETTLHVIFSCPNPPLLLTYDTSIGVHSLWRIREAKKEEYPGPSTSCDFSDFLPPPLTQRYPTPILKPAAYSRLSAAASPSSFLSRTSSPSEKGPCRFPQSPYVSSPQVSRMQSSKAFLQSPAQHSFVDSPSVLQSPDIFRSSATIMNSFHEDTYWHCIEPLEPEICLEHIWEEVTTVRHGNKGQATKAFITADVCGVKYICFLVPQISRLRLTKFSCGERQDQVIFGTTFDILAVDAAPIKDLNMILVLTPENNLTLYTGKHKGSEIKLIGVEAITQKRTSSFASPEDSAMSISSEVLFLSPVKEAPMSQSSSTVRDTSSSTVYGGASNEQKLCMTALRETTGTAAILQFNDGELYRMILPALARDSTVSSCLTGLQQVLNDDIAAKLVLRYYQLTNGMSNSQYDWEEEWQNFREAMWKLLGYRGNEESFTSVPAKKCKTNSDEGEEAWKFLLKSSSGHLEFLNDAGFSVPICEEVSGTENAESSSSWDRNALLYQYIPSVVFVFHLVHENLKLSTLTFHGARNLGKLLLNLTRIIGWDLYVAYYEKENPQFYGETCLVLKPEEQPSKNEMFFPTFITQEPPNIYRWLMECLKGNKVEKFPIIPKVCQQIYKIIMTYSLHIPRKDGTYNENPQDLFNTNLYNLAQSSQFNINEEEYKRCRTPVDRMVLFMAKTGFTKDDLEALPFGVSVPLREAIYQCRNDPSFHLPEASYTLIGREELAAQARIHEGDFYNCCPPKATGNGDDVDDGMNFECETTKLRFSIDHRIREVRRLLQSARPVHVSLVQNPEVSDHDFVQEQEGRLLMICKRTLSLSVGRGMFTLATSRPTLTELVPIPPLEITGRALPRNSVISLDHVDVPNDMLVWPAFHNGVAAGLRIIPGISQAQNNIDSTWIVYQRPKDNQLTNEHAGFLMALGLTGHLSNLATMNIHNYLSKGHELTSVGLLIGLAATKRGSMDASVTKMLSIHIDALLPPTSAEIDVPVSVMSAAVIGIGLVYQGTAHRLMTEVLLSEIGRPPGPEMENALNRECYSLSAGLALGLVMLEHGHGTVGVSDLNISDHLYHYMVGGHKKPQTGAQSEKFKSPSYLIKEGDNVDINVTAPGAILALGLIYLKSNNEIVASWLSAPETPVLAEFVRPDFLILKLLSRGLIMWGQVLPSKAWVESHIPKIFQDFAFKKNSKDINENVEIDFETISQTYVSIIAGCCLAMAMKFAGSFNQEAFKTLMEYTKYFKDALEKPQAEQCGRVILEQCLNIGLLSLSMVMAGSGNLDVLRIARELHKRHSLEITYGNHMSVHMAIGFLFLGAGRSTLSTCGSAIAALVCSLFPQMPITSSDNRCHLQALRHLYVLAVEPRLIVPRDVDTKEACYVPLQITLKETPYYPETVINQVAPCLLPDVDLIKQVNICGQRYWPIVLGGEMLSDELRLILSKGGTVFVKKRIGQLPYKQDIKGYRNLLARTFTEQAEKVDIIRSFSSDPELIEFTELFCHSIWSDLKEKRCSEFLSSVLFKCVSQETTSIIYTYFAIEKALQRVEDTNDIRALWELLLVLAYYESSFDRTKKTSVDVKRSISFNYTVEIKTRLDAHFQTYLDTGVGELQKYIKGSRDCMSSELACYLTYHGVQDARKLPVEFTQANVPLEALIMKCKELQISLSSLLRIRSVLER